MSVHRPKPTNQPRPNPTGMPHRDSCDHHLTTRAVLRCIRCEASADLGDALAAERRETVERIRDRLAYEPMFMAFQDEIRAILEEVSNTTSQQEAYS